MVEERKGWKKLTGIAAIIGALSLGSGVKEENNISTDKTQLEKESIVNVSTGTNPNFKHFYKSENPISWKEYQAKNNNAELNSVETKTNASKMQLEELNNLEIELKNTMFYTSTDERFSSIYQILDFIQIYKHNYYNPNNKKSTAQLETLFQQIRHLSLGLEEIEKKIYL